MLILETVVLSLKANLIKKKQASDTIYHTLKEAIATGQLPLGTRLKEEELAEIFELSRTPVREALKKLEMERLVEVTSTNGVIVRILSVDECLDTLEVLELLRSSAYNLLFGRIPRSLLMVLEQNTRHGEQLTDSAERYQNNAEFHELLVKATSNSVLIKLHTELAFIERIISNTIFPVHYASDYAEHHRKLIRAIIECNQTVLLAEVEHSKEKVEEYMQRIITSYIK